jgi:putative FmdB family regulatory protein
MPIYEYVCRDCGHRFEYLTLPASPRAECPACRNHDLEQLISLSAVSSEASRQTHLARAHKKAAAVRKEQQHDDHKRLHQHYD